MGTYQWETTGVAAGTVADLLMPLRTANESKVTPTGGPNFYLHSLSVELSSALTAGTVVCTVKNGGVAVAGSAVTVNIGQSFASLSYELVQAAGCVWTVEVNMSAGATPTPLDIKAELRVNLSTSNNSSIRYQAPSGTDPLQ